MTLTGFHLTLTFNQNLIAEYFSLDIQQRQNSAAVGILKGGVLYLVFVVLGHISAMFCFRTTGIYSKILQICPRTRPRTKKTRYKIDL